MWRMSGIGSELLQPLKTLMDFPLCLVDWLPYPIVTMRGPGVIRPQILRRSSNGRVGNRVKLVRGVPVDMLEMLEMMNW